MTTTKTTKTTPTKQTTTRNMANHDQPDYLNLKVPEGKQPEEYTWQERRADIVQNRIICDDGVVPWAINKAELGRHYDVDRATIHKDIEKRIKPYLKEHIGEAAEVDTDRLLKDIVSNVREDAVELREQGEYAAASKAEKRAAQVMDMWWGWLFDMGVKERSADKLEVDQRVEMETRERKVVVGVDFGELPGVDPEGMIGVHSNGDGGVEEIEMEDRDA